MKYELKMGDMVQLHLVHLLVVLALFRPSTMYFVNRRDPFASLLETLRTQQRAACDGDNLILQCPPGTKISIQLVIYGRSAPSDKVCPPTSLQPQAFTGREEVKCVIKEALRTVEELCQGKQSCSILTSSYTFGVSSFDPCPGVRKYIEVAYKCRPHSFTSRMLCGGETSEISCSKSGELLAIFTSSFTSVASGAIYCPVRSELFDQMNRRSEDEIGQKIKNCENSEVTSSLVNSCHGRRTCKITADPTSVGASSCSNLHVFLKTAYACVNSEVFLEKYLRNHDVGSIRPDLMSDKLTENITTVLPDKYSVSSRIPKQTEVVVSDPKMSDFPVTKTSFTTPTRTAEDSPKHKTEIKETELPARHIYLSFLSGFLHIYNVLQTNLPRLLLILTTTTCLGLSFLLLLVIVHLCRKKKKPLGPSSSSQCVDLDTCDLADYQIEQARDILPEPRIMTCPVDNETQNKFHSLSRKAARNVKIGDITRIAPLEDYLGGPPGDTAIRYSTIGRSKGGGAARSVPATTPPPYLQEGRGPGQDYLYY